MPCLWLSLWAGHQGWPGGGELCVRPVLHVHLCTCSPSTHSTAALQACRCRREGHAAPPTPPPPSLCVWAPIWGCWLGCGSVGQPFLSHLGCMPTQVSPAAPPHPLGQSPTGPHGARCHRGSPHSLPMPMGSPWGGVGCMCGGLAAPWALCLPCPPPCRVGGAVWGMALWLWLGPCSLTCQGLEVRSSRGTRSYSARGGMGVGAHGGGGSLGTSCCPGLAWPKLAALTSLALHGVIADIISCPTQKESLETAHYFLDSKH